ncbi:NAD(P)H-quinone oxidoreductase [Massilia sp. W12]|uniref:NAD(P)H-quinone oxidoreductase n=1 Tax=Massilia sp. W12 TaxID=3126507 RepID=UPI0030D2DC16
MRAVEIAGFGGPEVLRLCSMPIPQAGPGEVLVRVHAAGVNRPDVLQRMGKYQPPPGASLLPGLELAGEVAGGDVTAFSPAGPLQIGTRVCALVAGGAYAEYCVVPAALCMPLPPGWDMLQAAGLPETCMTVWSNLVQRAGLRAGQRVLVHGGSSGIGVTAIQIARALGCEVLVTAGSEEKCRACLALGAQHAINYRQQNFAQAVQEITGGQGVHVVLDMVAGDYLDANLRILADDGCLVIIALQGGSRATLDMGQILRRRLHVTGSTLRPRDLAFKAQLAQEVTQSVWPMMADGRFIPVIHQVFDLEQAGAAHAMMESNAHIGKLLLRVV